jgi:benzoate-CoA ligase family protein
VTDVDTFARFSPILRQSRYLKQVIVVGAEEPYALEGKYVTPYRMVHSMSAQYRLADTSRDDIAIWLFTSGSTGHPKAAVHMHHDFAFNTERYAKAVLGIRESDRTLSVPKLFFGYATGTNLMFPFAVGASTVLFSERSTADALYENIERFRPTVLTSVPTMINAMLNHSSCATADLSSLRICLSAGEALPEELCRRWMDRVGIEILDGIGSAEMFHIYITNYPGEMRPGSLGRLVPGYEARIVGPDGQEVPPGEVGTLHIKGDSAALCYWNDHVKSKATFAGDWCFTSDQFAVDDAGFFWYHGRTDDMLKVSGIWVSPLEIENCLLQHPAVSEVCVVGFEDETGLIKSRAWIVCSSVVGEGLEEALKAFVKERLAPHKYPRNFRFVESLPKNDRGKVDRKIIKQWS